MANVTITQTDDSSNTKTDPGTLMDEFLPIIEFNLSEYQKKYEKEERSVQLEEDKNGKQTRAKLSKHLDTQNHEIQVLLIKTKQRKIKLPFTVMQGSKDSEDDDGIVTTSISTKDGKIKLLSKEEVRSKYKSNLLVEIEITGEENKEFYVQFYARDNEDDRWNTGELKDVYCGCVKVEFEYCICSDEDWPSLESMVNEADKVVYSRRTVIPWMKKGDKAECYHFALHQLRVLDYWVKTERWNKKWDGTKELGEHIYQLSLDVDVAGMKKGPQKDMFKKGLTYLKQAMKSKTPVMVGLDYSKGYANEDLITDHFAVITGCGKDSGGRLYFDVTDNAFGYQKYYCNCTDFEIRSEDQSIIITQIRESKKL